MPRPVVVPAALAALLGVVALAWLLRDPAPPPVVPLPDGTAQQSQAGTSPDADLLADAGRATGVRDVRLLPSGRPGRTPTHPDENRQVPPAPTISPAWVGAMVLQAPVVLADTALPWRYHLSTSLDGVVSEAAVHQGVTAWDGQPGSRWATSFAGWTTTATAVADGQSTIFLDDGCEGLTNANAYLFTDGGLAVGRYGASGTQILEADIGVCPRATGDADVVRALRHEVGHVVGLAHLCTTGDPCWQEGMGALDHGCRTMFWQARACQVGLDEGDVQGLRARYGTLRPLRAPTTADLAARAAFATVPDDAGLMAVVVEEASTPADVLPAAATLAGRTGGALLVDRADADLCLTGPAREEVNRTLRRRGTLVLVGAWPESCRTLAFDWDVAVRRVATDDPALMAVALAALGGPTDRAVLVLGGDGTAPGDAAAAAALAGTSDAALLLLGRDGTVPPPTRGWLAGDDRPQVTVVGGPGEAAATALATLATQGTLAAHLQGPDRIATALAVATGAGPDGASGGSPVVLAGADTTWEALLGAVVAAHDGGVLLLSPPVEDPRVTSWLLAHGPVGGWAVGDGPALPGSVAWAYGALVG